MVQGCLWGCLCMGVEIIHVYIYNKPTAQSGVYGGGQALQNTDIFTIDNKALLIQIPITINYR